MKTIQWFPGHMAKAVRMMEEQLRLCDAVLFVLDARAPASSYNARLADMAGGKPVLYLLNKGDLADGGADMAAARMQKAGRAALRISAASPAALRPLTAAMEAVAAGKRARLAEKGVSKPVRFLVAGIHSGCGAARSNFWTPQAPCRPPLPIRRSRGGSLISAA